MRVVIAGGGTGGHVIPALAIARELRARYNAYVLFIGTPRGIETRLVPAAGFELKLIRVGALKNVSLATRVKTVFDLPVAIVRSLTMIQDFRPHVVIGVGGYASGPGMMAAILQRIPTLAFEPNLVPGFANRAIGRRVKAAAVHFPETAKFFRNAEVTGVPVRQDFFQLPARPQGLPPSLLVFGGSQGARAINRAVMSALPQLKERLPGIRIVHQTGERDYQDAQMAYIHADLAAEISPFIQDMPMAFAGADLVVCRAGASTVAEVAAAGKPAIFIPFPQAADDHQRRNAEALAERGAAVLIPEAELTPEKLAQQVTELLKDKLRLHEMGRQAAALAHPEATERIARIAARLAGFEVQSAQNGKS